MNSKQLEEDTKEELVSDLEGLKLSLVSHKEVEGISCDPVVNKDIPGILEKIEDMEKIVTFHKGLGIAAPQIGTNKQFYLAFINGNYELFCNARYIKGSGSRDTHGEGCLSYPGLKHAKVKRWKSVTLFYDMVVNKELVNMRKTFNGVDAFVHQHECDHLIGKTIYIK